MEAFKKLYGVLFFLLAKSAICFFLFSFWFCTLGYFYPVLGVSIGGLAVLAILLMMRRR